MITRVFIPVAALLAFAVLAAGCGSPSAQARPVEIAEFPVGDQEVMDLRNCQGDEALRTTLADQYKLEGRVEFAGETCAAGGENLPIPPAALDELSAQVERRFQPEVEQLREELRAEELVVPVGRIYMYHVRRMQREYRSGVEFDLDGRRCVADYTYRVEFPKIEDRWTTSCTA